MGNNNNHNFPDWILRRVEAGKARVYPHGHFNVQPKRTLRAKLDAIHDIEELEGLANRRRVTGLDLPKWTQSEIEQIKERLWILRNG